jgi:predicted Rossmann fold flavoprotein
MAGIRNKVVVIGGGPAGLMAAGQAALKNANVTLLEKKDRPALKLRITGNTRCNLTNMAPLDEFIGHFGHNGKFLRTVFSQFFCADLRKFFEDINVSLRPDERGRVYPKSNQADEVADALLAWTKKCRTKMITFSSAAKILVDDNRVTGVQVLENNRFYPANAVVVATGGASYPATGSSGDGFRLTESLGHTIIPIRPALVPLLTNPDFVRKLKGVSFDSVSVILKINGKATATATGGLLFTHYGISGPAVLSLSRLCVDEIRKGNQPILSIDFIPGYSENRLDEIFLESFKVHGKSRVRNILKETIPDRVALLFLSAMGIEPDKPCSQISATERRKIRLGLKEFDIVITGHRSINKAMVTAGGVSLNEINPGTMQSRLIKGLYFAGEVLDLDADSGGFNLQAAFSTGWLAGRMCAIPDRRSS